MLWEKHLRLCLHETAECYLLSRLYSVVLHLQCLEPLHQHVLCGGGNSGREWREQRARRQNTQILNWQLGEEKPGTKTRSERWTKITLIKSSLQFSCTSSPVYRGGTLHLGAGQLK